MRTLLLLIVVALAACSSEPDEARTPADGGGGVYTVNYPLWYFASRIAGDAVPIHFPVPDGEDPAFWVPTDADIAAMQEADLVLLNGASYAKWLDLVSLPGSRTVNTSESFADAYLELPVMATHSHGEAGAHSHAGTDFNTWLDPRRARKQVEAVRVALSKLLPRNAEAFQRRADELAADLDALDESLRALSKEPSKVPLVSSHPVYGYLAQGYGWELRSVLWEPDRMPTEEQWEELETLQLVWTDATRWMIFEDEPLPAIKERLLKDYEMQVVVFRPCGRRPPGGDYLSEMRAGIERLKVVFAE